MSASAIVNQIQYQDAFANKKQQHSKPLEGGSTSNAAEPKYEFNIGKTNLEDPFKFDDSGYLSNACYNGNSKGKGNFNPDQDAVDDESIYSTPIGQSKVAAATTASSSVDTPIPYNSNNPTDDNDNVSKTDRDSSSKQVDDYDKIVKVIHDHITRELPALPPREQQQQESKPQSVEREGEAKTCCCGHKAAEKSASTDEKEGSAGGVEEPAAEEKAVAVDPEDQSEGKEEKDEGDDTVIVTPKAEPIQAEEKVQEKVEEDTEHVENAKEKDTEQQKDDLKPDVVEK